MGTVAQNRWPLNALRMMSSVGLFAVLAVIGCGSPGASTEGRRLADTWVAAWNAHSVEQVLGLFEPNGTYQDPATPGPISGLALRQFLFQQWSIWGDLTLTVRSARGDAQWAVIEWRSRGTHPSGKTITIDGVTVLDRRERIVRASTYYDATVYLQFLAVPKRQ